VLSATGFTLVGVMNKLVSVLLSMLIYRNIGSPLSIGCLLLCIVAGSLYK
jgi:GDP-mannose transporter